MKVGDYVKFNKVTGRSYDGSAMLEISEISFSRGRKLYSLVTRSNKYYVGKYTEDKIYLDLQEKREIMLNELLK